VVCSKTCSAKLIVGNRPYQLALEQLGANRKHCLHDIKYKNNYNLCIFKENGVQWNHYVSLSNRLDTSLNVSSNFCQKEFIISWIRGKTQGKLGEFYVLTAVKMTMFFCWVVTPCRLAVDTNVQRNVQVHTASQTSRTSYCTEEINENNIQEIQVGNWKIDRSRTPGLEG
jgi:hypothetical protein